MTQHSRHTPGGGEEAPYPAPAYAWYTAFVLMLAYMLAFLDRQILSLMVAPIKRDLGISDTGMSLILGLAFAIFYTVLGIPIGWLGDRANRRSLIAGGIAIWSLMTAACGLARSYGQLFFARIGVGFGEATLQPCALSLLSDYFPREKRGLAVSVYSMGLGLGAGMALMLGGQVVAAASNAPPVTLPIVGQLFAWQTVFIVIGLPGLIVSLLMLTVREPVRRDRTSSTAGGAPFGTVVTYLWARRATYLSHFVGLSVMTVIGNAVLAWMPMVFVRGHGWDIGRLSLPYGLVLGLGGPVGAILGGWIGDRLYRRGVKDGHMRAALYGTLVLVPAAVLAPLMPSPELTILMLIPFSIGSGVATAAGPASLMVIAPSEMRAQISAIYWFVISTLGLAIGPFAVGFLTDRVFQSEAAVGSSIATVAGVFGVVVAGLLIYVLKPYRETVAEAEARSAAA